eukprot:8821768-Lingulodinium_polyedra.AAC.1
MFPEAKAAYERSWLNDGASSRMDIPPHGQPAHRDAGTETEPEHVDPPGHPVGLACAPAAAGCPSFYAMVALRGSNVLEVSED